MPGLEILGFFFPFRVFVGSESSLRVRAIPACRSPEDRQFMMALLLHCADISNAVKPFAIAEKCALLCPKTTENPEPFSSRCRCNAVEAPPCVNLPLPRQQVQSW